MWGYGGNQILLNRRNRIEYSKLRKSLFPAVKVVMCRLKTG